jgi:hypothetical protein
VSPALTVGLAGATGAVGAATVKVTGVEKTKLPLPASVPLKLAVLACKVFAGPSVPEQVNTHDELQPEPWLVFVMVSN